MEDTNSKSNWCPVCMVGMDPDCNNGKFPQDRKGKGHERSTGTNVETGSLQIRIAEKSPEGRSSARATALASDQVQAQAFQAAIWLYQLQHQRQLQQKTPTQKSRALKANNKLVILYTFLVRWSDLVAFYIPTGSYSTSCRAVSMLRLEPDLKVLFKKQISGRGPPHSSYVALVITLQTIPVTHTFLGSIELLKAVFLIVFFI
ncbi:hypothetical protein SELMODRAFT_410371 [Selaginella moellendorffii]|uniref:Uncharacterized protein n=1 Tax=Selaginella moellendorffii TaxID=88036 RepID=D8REJ5_SELML|nr:hypothetical protein SELMODRAFT_410371 [Selaginella moellendorffii]